MAKSSCKKNLGRDAKALRRFTELTSAGGRNETSSVPDPDALGDMVPRPWRKNHRPRFGELL
jgi:hypothetical protein